MKSNQCEQELEAVAALRTGIENATLDRHLAECAPCGEARAVAALLLRHRATVGAGGSPLPSANLIWRMAQARQQAKALRRATRALVWMQALGTAYLTLLLAWALRLPWLQTGVGRGALWSLLADRMVVAGAGLALLTVASGAGLLLLLGKKDDRFFVSI